MNKKKQGKQVILFAFLTITSNLFSLGNIAKNFIATFNDQQKKRTEIQYQEKLQDIIYEQKKELQKLSVAQSEELKKIVNNTVNIVEYLNRQNLNKEEDQIIFEQLQEFMYEFNSTLVELEKFPAPIKIVYKLYSHAPQLQIKKITSDILQKEWVTDFLVKIQIQGIQEKKSSEEITQTTQKLAQILPYIRVQFNLPFKKKWLNEMHLWLKVCIEELEKSPIPSLANENKRQSKKLKEADYTLHHFHVPESAYHTLGLPNFTNTESIKRQYRKLMRTYHPDKNPGNAFAHKKTQQLNAAYDELKENNSKHFYDTQLKERIAQFEQENSLFDVFFVYNPLARAIIVTKFEESNKKNSLPPIKKKK